MVRQIYKLSLWRNLISGFLTILLLPTLGFILLFSFLKMPWNIITPTILLIPVLGGITIHLTYIFNDFGKTIILEDNFIKMNKFGKTVKYSLDEIKFIEKYSTSTWKNPWQNYKALKIVFVNNDKIIVTSLSANIETFLHRILPQDRQVNTLIMWSYLPIVKA